MKARHMISLLLALAITVVYWPSVVIAGGGQVNRPPFGNPTTPKPPPPPRPNPQAPGK
jgi:hypothetical protein